MAISVWPRRVYVKNSIYGGRCVLLGGLLWKGEDVRGWGGEKERVTSWWRVLVTYICSVCVYVMGIGDTKRVGHAHNDPRVNLITNIDAMATGVVPGF